MRETGTMSTGEDLDRDRISADADESDTGVKQAKEDGTGGGETIGSETLINFTAIEFLMFVNFAAK